MPTMHYLSEIITQNAFNSNCSKHKLGHQSYQLEFTAQRITVNSIYFACVEKLDFQMVLLFCVPIHLLAVWKQGGSEFSATITKKQIVRVLTSVGPLCLCVRRKPAFKAFDWHVAVLWISLQTVRPTVSSSAPTYVPLQKCWSSIIDGKLSFGGWKTEYPSTERRKRRIHIILGRPLVLRD